jgi:putative thioredoxin
MIELTEADFQTQVIETSHRIPVLVDFWADWCAPCKMLHPVLEKLAGEYGEQLCIAKVNTDQERALAEQQGIRSLPTLQLYRNGELVEQLLGVQPDTALRSLIDAHLARASDKRLQEALACATKGDPARAVELLEQAWQEDPGNSRLPLNLAELYIDTAQFDRATGLLASLPHELRESDVARGLRLLAEFAGTAANAPDVDTLVNRLADQPTDSQARYQLAAQQAVSGDYEAALATLMELLQRDRSFGDGAAQRGLLAVFSRLGEDDPRVATCRRQLFALLH